MKLFSKYTVFFEQVVDDVLLLTLDETSQGEYEKLEGKVLGKAAHLHRCSAALMRTSDRNRTVLRAGGLAVG